jgi:integrase
MNATKLIDTGIPASAIGSLRVVDGQHRRIAVTWLAGRRRGRLDIVDLSPLIDTHRFYAPLRRNADLFNTAQIINDGHAIAWGDGSIDMSADSIERLAEEAMTGADFSEFLRRHRLTHQAAAAALGRSKRQIENYLQYDTLPRMVVLACIGYESRHEVKNVVDPFQATFSYSYKGQARLWGWTLPVFPGALTPKVFDHCG